MKTSDLTDVEFLRAVRDRTIRDLPYPAKLIDSKLMKLYDRGLIEYGVSLWFPWLTDEGKAALAKLEQKTDSSDSSVIAS